MRHSHIRWLIFVLLVVILATQAACRSRSSESREQPDTKSIAGPDSNGLAHMPAFTLKDVTGNPVSSDQFRGKVLLVNFWATWCPPCKKEMPGFEELQKRYQQRGLVVIGITMDSDAAVVAQFAKELGVTYPLLMSTPTVLQQWEIIGLPTTYLVDREGRVRKKVIGFEYKEAFETALKQILYLRFL